MIGSIYDLLKNGWSFVREHFTSKPKFSVRPDTKTIDIKATSQTIAVYIKNLSSKPHNLTNVRARIEELPDEKIDIFKPELKLPFELKPNEAEKLIRFGVSFKKLDQDKEYTLVISFLSWWKEKDIDAGILRLSIIK